MTCQNCGRASQADGTPTHHMGCRELLRQRARNLVEPDFSTALRERTRESECVKDGCTNPRAVSKGPRPTKYCDEHKTGSKK